MSDALESRGLMRRLFEAKSLEEMSAPTKIVVYAVLGLWTLVVLFPLYWVLVTSFKVEVEVDSGPFYIPFVDFKPTLDAWNFMLLQNNTLGPYINSIVVTLSSTVLALIIGALAAYALVRIRFEVKLAAIVTFLVLLVAVIVAVAALHVAWQVAGAVAIALFLLALGTFVRRFKAAVSNNDIEFWMISNRIMPPIVAVLPIYVMFQHLQLLDTQFALIATYTGVNLPIVVWLTRDFFAGVPLDLEESAEIDGASKFRVFFTIALPLVRSGLAATFMLVFILAWNEFLLALFLTNARAQTMPVLVAAQNTTRGPAMVVHVGADRHHDRAGHRHRSLPAEAYCARSARRRGQGIAPMRVRLENIYKSFGSVEVVKGLNLEVQDGEFLVLLGASGSGKTTALRMIAGLEKVSSGSIRIGDRDVTNVLPKYRDIAMVFQSYALYPHMTVFANIAYPLTVRRQPKAEVEAAVKDVARQVQLDMLLDRYPRQLSGGQRQRVALARAMIRRPAAFLMDEPLIQSRRQAARLHARRAQAHAASARHHDPLCDARPDRGDDARPSRGAAREGRAAAAGHAGKHVQCARQSLCRRLHRIAADELLRRRACRGPFLRSSRDLRDKDARFKTSGGRRRPTRGLQGHRTGFGQDRRRGLRD